jgi:hypothetical protein
MLFHIVHLRAFLLESAPITFTPTPDHHLGSLGAMVPHKREREMADDRISSLI